MGLYYVVPLMARKMGEPPLDPPDGPGEVCANLCGENVGDDAHAVELPGMREEVWTCSAECAAEYVSCWAESMYEAHEDAKLWN